MKVLVSGAGLLTVDRPGWTIWAWLFDATTSTASGRERQLDHLPGRGLRAAALLYIGARFVRRSQGVDLDAIHSEIPAE
jgi:hypothetical protein